MILIELLKDIRTNKILAWTVYNMSKFDTPAAVIIVDITGNGFMDVVLCYDFGTDMFDSKYDGGWVR